MTPPKRRRILITGATGTVGVVLADRLDGEYDVVRHGLRPEPEHGLETEADPEDIHTGEVTSYDDMAALMDGVDTVVHLAGAASPDSDWETVLDANIVGFRNVIEAARVAGVRRFVFASSNHVMGMYDRDGEWPVYSKQPTRPDSLYGVSKVFGEALGRFYHDEHGLDVICLRIGWSSGDPMLADEEILHAMWLSEDDTVEAFRCAIEADVTWGVYYVVSDNPNRRWDLTDTMLDLGYRPKDSWLDHADGGEDVVQGGADVRKDWPKDD